MKTTKQQARTADRLRKLAVAHEAGAPRVEITANTSGESSPAWPLYLDPVHFWVDCENWWQRLRYVASVLTSAHYERFISQSPYILRSWLCVEPVDYDDLANVALADQSRVASATDATRSRFLRDVLGRRGCDDPSPLELALDEIPRRSVRPLVRFEGRRSAISNLLCSDEAANLEAGVTLVYWLVPRPGAESMASVRAHRRVYGAVVGRIDCDRTAACWEAWKAYLQRAPGEQLSSLGWYWTLGTGVRPASKIHQNVASGVTS